MFFLIKSLKILLDKNSRLKLNLIFFGIIFQTILETAGIGVFLPMIIFAVDGDGRGRLRLAKIRIFQIVMRIIRIFP